MCLYADIHSLLLLWQIWTNSFRLHGNGGWGISKTLHSGIRFQRLQILFPCKQTARMWQMLMGPQVPSVYVLTSDSASVLPPSVWSLESNASGDTWPAIPSARRERCAVLKHGKNVFLHTDTYGSWYFDNFFFFSSIKMVSEHFGHFTLLACMFQSSSLLQSVCFLHYTLLRHI